MGGMIMKKWINIKENADSDGKENKLGANEK